MSSLTAAKVVASRKSTSYWVLKAVQLLQKDRKEWSNSEAGIEERKWLRTSWKIHNLRNVYILLYIREQF